VDASARNALGRPRAALAEIVVVTVLGFFAMLLGVHALERPNTTSPRITWDRP